MATERAILAVLVVVSNAAIIVLIYLGVRIRQTAIRNAVLAFTYVFITASILHFHHFPFLAMPEAQEWWNIGWLASIGSLFGISAQLVWEMEILDRGWSLSFWILTFLHVSILFAGVIVHRGLTNDAA